MTGVPKSLSGRLLLSASVLVVFALLATGIAMTFTLRRFVQGQIDGRIDAQILSVADALRVGPDGSLRLERVVDGPPFERPMSGWYWAVLTPDPVLRSRSLVSGAFALGAPRPEPHPGRTAFDGTGPRGEALRVRAREVDIGGRIVTVAATAPLEALSGPLHEALTPLVIILALLGAALIGGVLLQVRLGLRPLARLRHELARVRSGGADRISHPQPREIAPLVGELNTLLDQHAANLERARRHVANLAHGLKTPLASLAITLAESACDADGRLMALVATMDRRVRHHLTRARVAALGGPERARTPVAPRVADHVSVFAKLYAEKHLRYGTDVPAHAVVACEAQDLDEMLGNLLDNASKWAKREVRVAATSTGARVVLSIEDDGTGLTDQQAVGMMEPGRRIDEDAPGYGFGLPITRELAELYGGSIELGPSTLGGLSARLSLPMAATDSA